MKKLFQFLTLAAAMVVSLSVMGRAQDVSRTPQPFNPDGSSSATEATIVVLSGCLGQGSGAHEYSLHQADTVTSWELKSDGVNLAGNMNQMVVITAVKSDNPYTPLKVIALRMDSSSCDSW
jgi:hypothetical protein